MGALLFVFGEAICSEAFLNSLNYFSHSCVKYQTIDVVMFDLPILLQATRTSNRSFATTSLRDAKTSVY